MTPFVLVGVLAVVAILALCVVVIWALDRLHRRRKPPYNRIFRQ